MARSASALTLRSSVTRQAWWAAIPDPRQACSAGMRRDEDAKCSLWLRPVTKQPESWGPCQAGGAALPLGPHSDAPNRGLHSTWEPTVPIYLVSNGWQRRVRTALFLSHLPPSYHRGQLLNQPQCSASAALPEGTVHNVLRNGAQNRGGKKKMQFIIVDYSLFRYNHRVKNERKAHRNITRG